MIIPWGITSLALATSSLEDRSLASLDGDKCAKE